MDPLTGKVGGTLHRIDLSGRTLILNSDNPDRTAHPTQTFDLTGKNLAEILVGDVAWVGRTLRSGKRR